MSRKKNAKSHIRKITKVGGYTYQVTLPKDEMDRLGWRDKQKVVVSRYGKGFLIQDWKPSAK